MATATRGDLGLALFEALGIEPTGTGRFTDAGYLDAVATTLADLGITRGVNAENFGPTMGTTRGQAFTMIARALGLADANDSIERASQALVEAGIVRGYGNTGNLGLDDPLRAQDLETLMGRVAPEFNRGNGSGGTLRDTLAMRADSERDARRSRQDPAFAAFLREVGISEAAIDDEIRTRQELYNLDTKRRAEDFARAAEESRRGVATDFENRGLFRSGTRAREQQRVTEDTNRALSNANTAAQRDFESGTRALERERLGLNRELSAERLAYETRQRTREIEAPYGP